MKKNIYTILASLAVAATVSAADYTDTLVVDVNGSTSEQSATISLNQDGDKYVFALKNFILVAGGQKMGVGTIELKNVEGTTKDGVTTLKSKQTVSIAAGDDPSISMWMGPMLPPVPIDIVAKQQGDRLYAVINIDMQSSMNQIIRVTFGRGYQLPNGGFENYRAEGSKKIEEPIGWHSFASSKGSFAGFVSGTKHTESSDLVRPGSKGQKSVLVTSTSIFGIIANGTITTGQMNAGSMSATDVANHAEMDMSSTSKDSNGDPFYAALSGRPDSIAVWLKFKQSKPQADHPYATITAAITDGTYYQEPDSKEYSNVMAYAKNNRILSNDFAWQRIAVPFSYTDGVTGKAVMVTISTNADAGKGSVDTLYVDDAELIYNSGLASISLNGTPVALEAGKYEYDVEGASGVTADNVVAEADGRGATTETTVETTADGQKVTVTVTSDDLLTSHAYTFNVKGSTTGVNSAAKDAPARRVRAIYDASGARISQPQKGEVYVKVYDDGTSEKAIGK